MDFGQVKIRAHALRKSNRQKLELKAYTQEETQNDERNYDPNNALLRHWNLGRSLRVSSKISR